MASTQPVRAFDGPVPALVMLARHPWCKRDVAAEHGVSTRTVGRWMTRGCPHVKPFGLTGPVRFAPLEVAAWLARIA